VAVVAEGTAHLDTPLGDPYAAGLLDGLCRAGVAVCWVATGAGPGATVVALTAALASPPRAVVWIPGRGTRAVAAAIRLRVPGRRCVRAVPAPCRDGGPAGPSEGAGRWTGRVPDLVLDRPRIPATWRPPAGPATTCASGFVVVCPQPLGRLPAARRVLAGLAGLVGAERPDTFRIVLFCERSIRPTVEAIAADLGVEPFLGLPAPVPWTALPAAIADADLALCVDGGRPDRDALGALCAIHLGLPVAADRSVARRVGLRPGYTSIDLAPGPSGVAEAVRRARALSPGARAFRRRLAWREVVEPLARSPDGAAANRLLAHLLGRAA